MLLDEDRLRSERSDRKLWKSRVAGPDDGLHGIAGGNDLGHRPPRRRERPQRNTEEEDVEYRLAIEASKHEAEEDRKRRERNARMQDDDDELAKAIRLSKEEEELRRRELEESNAASLFDDTTPAAQPQPTGYNQGYQQQGAVDWFGNPVDAQQSMTTGFLNNQYSQPTGFQPQPTGFANGYSNGFQPNSFDQSQFTQQQTGFLQPQPTLQPQQTAFSNNNPYGNDIWGQQQQQQQQQQNDFLQPGSHNPWAHQQQPADALKPAPTGSNNPFASSFTRSQAQMQQQPHRTGAPSLNTLAEQKTATQPSFNNPILGYQAPQQQQQQQQQQDPQHARLNALLATGEGQDTFGNVGDLRIPAQHTTPGVFINSAGAGLERFQAAQTANNPFLNQSFTGVPQQTGFVGQPNSNPFGARQSQQSGSLIDL